MFIGNLMFSMLEIWLLNLQKVFCWYKASIAAILENLIKYG